MGIRENQSGSTGRHFVYCVVVYVLIFGISASSFANITKMRESREVCEVTCVILLLVELFLNTER